MQSLLSRPVPSARPVCFQPRGHRAPAVRLISSVVRSSSEDGPGGPATKNGSRGAREQKELSPGMKVVWYAAEALGKITALGKGAAPGTATSAEPVVKLSRDEAIARIRDDYDKDYFISGAGSMSAYAPDCEFSDPFVAFRGVERFQTNVGNLGRLMSDIKLDVYDFQESGANEVTSRWRFSCLLDLPWTPRIAAAGNTTHVLDEATGLCVKHIERWEVEPEKVIRQLFRPAAKVPSNAAEILAVAVSDGDGKGVWLALSPTLLKVSLGVLAVTLVGRVATGDSVSGLAEGGGALLLAATCTTEVLKFAGLV